MTMYNISGFKSDISSNSLLQKNFIDYVIFLFLLMSINMVSRL